ncbi:hypothetical protein TOPH_04368 [Tolypocladium ophioglossoides CBS 100239]|uniref:Nucleoside phosphorylase domain-containing protein n=1 Tax=Tolypocladium ophioglossoides (strain CBS 100239) TaxID=1163406 RepID=A0A0L0NAA0_TOLOC|nr:hypothetical protein TOPH_04368 [Tolypocladium ophioglossoides CBS 100239]
MNTRMRTQLDQSIDLGSRKLRRLSYSDNVDAAHNLSKKQKLCHSDFRPTPVDVVRGHIEEAPPRDCNGGVRRCRPLHREDFEIAIICALPLEYDAVCLLLDEFWDEDGDQYGRATGDPNTYTTGRIGKHSLVLALLHRVGKASAAGAAARMRSSYSGLRLTILVGICGGVLPRTQDGDEILLGDVIIGKTIIHYDYGRQYPDGFMRKISIADNPSIQGGPQYVGNVADRTWPVPPPSTNCRLFETTADQRYLKQA